MANPDSTSLSARFQTFRASRETLLVPKRGGWLEGEGEAEDGAAARRLGEGQLAAVEARDLGRDPQAEPVAALALGGEERLEDPRAQIGGHARAVVLPLDQRVPVQPARAQTQPRAGAV